MKVKAANWEMFMLPEEVRNRIESTYGAPRFGPEVWCHLAPESERNRAFNPDFDWVDRAMAVVAFAAVIVPNFAWRSGLETQDPWFGFWRHPKCQTRVPAKWCGVVRL